MVRVSRPRIRTLKPETWQDEKIGCVSRDARLLFVGLITLADDDGRFRALPSQVLGHVFPYDDDAVRKLGRWMDELSQVGLVVLYDVAGVQYGVLPQFGRHQKINRPSPSLIPEPSLNGHGAISEDVSQ